ncbi:hypothetical protein OAA24_00850, partial [bacterium]|nr:hypothetical protein [bacterium]
MKPWNYAAIRGSSRIFVYGGNPESREFSFFPKFRDFRPRETVELCGDSGFGHPNAGEHDFSGEHDFLLRYVP